MARSAAKGPATSSASGTFYSWSQINRLFLVAVSPFDLERHDIGFVYRVADLDAHSEVGIGEDANSLAIGGPDRARRRHRSTLPAPVVATFSPLHRLLGCLKIEQQYILERLLERHDGGARLDFGRLRLFRPCPVDQVQAAKPNQLASARKIQR